MKNNYDFLKARRAKDVPHLAKLQETASRGKTCIAVMLDDEVIDKFKSQVETVNVVPEKD